LYRELLQNQPDSPLLRERLRAKLAEIYLRGSDRKGAVEQLEALLKDDPTNVQAYYYLASIAFEEKRLTDAVEYFRKTILLSPDFEPAYYDLAQAQLGLSQNSDALATLDKARGKFNQNFVLEYLTAVAFSAQKAYPESIRHFTAAEVWAKANEPKRLDERFYFQYGAACERKGDLVEAEKYFRKCLALDPDFTEAMNYLGYMWAEHGQNLDEARQLIEKAVKAEPKNGAFLDSLGWVLFKQDHLQDALEYIRQATELLEGTKEADATVYDHLGDIYFSLKDFSKAKSAWKKSLDLEPSEEVRKKYEAANP
jgi:tetratricopeptide (TPR) repeat protein